MEKRKILIVDNSRFFLEMEGGYLKRDSFDLHTAGTGVEAIDTARKLEPHLILLSSALPDSRPEQICSTIKNDPSLSMTKVVIMTTDYDDELLAGCVDAGCDGIVTRPLKKGNLLETVQKLLGETFRRQTRMSVQLPCAIYLDRIGIPGTLLDISGIGCRVTTEEPVDKDITIGVGFNLPETDQPVNWKGIVRWSFQGGDGKGHFVLGVEFIDTPQEELEMLKDILASMPDGLQL